MHTQEIEMLQNTVFIIEKFPGFYLTVNYYSSLSAREPPPWGLGCSSFTQQQRLISYGNQARETSFLEEMGSTSLYCSATP